MSVSEKLKAALAEAEMLGTTNVLTDVGEQIVAVVEAAEQREAVHILNIGAETSMASLLRALDEKLGDISWNT